MARIELDNIGKVYADGFEAVKGLTLDIADGEFMIFVGPSGCGKSTALRMIAGLEEISSGELRIDGVRVNELEPKDRDISMVFQSYALYPHLTVRQNLEFPLKIAKVPAEQANKAVAEAAEFLQLTEHLDRKPANLSGGQRQRVAMGRAVVRSPKAFLMDEPLSNLDAKLRVQTRTALAKLQRRLGTTTIYVTHDQVEAMTLGHRVAVLNGGELQQVGTPRELYEHPRNVFVGGFIGSPAMNFVDGVIRGGTLHTAMGDLELNDHWRNQLGTSTVERQVLLGVRPEGFSDADLQKGNGPTFNVEVEVVESMGSDLFVYFNPVGKQPKSQPVENLAQDVGASDLPFSSPGDQVVARLPPHSQVKVGDTARLRIDRDTIALFDPKTGLSLAEVAAAETVAA